MPPRHIDIPGGLSLMSSLGNLSFNALTDLGNILINTGKGILNLNFQGIFKNESLAKKQLSDATDKLISGHKTSAQYNKFDQDGSYLFSTIGLSTDISDLRPETRNYVIASYLLSLTTEVAFPTLAAMADVFPLSFDGDLNKECIFNSSKFLSDQLSKLAILISQKDHISETDWAMAWMEYVFIDLIMEPDTWL